MQKAACKSNQLITEHGLTINAQKTKLIAFKGRDPSRSKTVVHNSITEHVNSVHYSGNKFDKFDKKNWITISKYQALLTSVLRPQKILKKTGIKLYHTLTVPA